MVPDAQDDMRALSPVQPTPQVSTLHQDIHSTSTAINTVRRQQHGHNNITTASSSDGRQCYNSASGIMRQGSYATSTPVGALKSKKRLMRIGGERISGPERRISTQSSARAARCILDSLEDMTSPLQGAGNLGQSLLYTDSAFRDNRRWGGGSLSALPSKSSALCGPPPPLKSIAAESVVHNGPSETRLVVTRGRRNGNSAGTQRQQLSQEAVAEIPRLERKTDGGGSPKWLHEPSYPSSSYTPARVTSREVQTSSSSSVMNVVDNSISSPSLYSLERWQPPPKRQRATMVREQQTQTEDIGETWDVQKASLRGKRYIPSYFMVVLNLVIPSKPPVYIHFCYSHFVYCVVTSPHFSCGSNAYLLSSLFFHSCLFFQVAAVISPWEVESYCLHDCYQRRKKKIMIMIIS